MSKIGAMLVAMAVGLGSMSAFAADEMKKDEAAPTKTAKKAAPKAKAKAKSVAKKDDMKKDDMKKDGMKKDSGMTK